MALFCSNCDNQIEEGRVYDKEFFPAHDEEVTTFQTIIIDEDTSISYPVTTTYHYPDRWIIRIEKVEQKANKQGVVKTVRKTREFIVKHNVYDDISIGDWYFYSPNSAEIEKPVVEKSERKR
jgi:hypothetical protein